MTALMTFSKNAITQGWISFFRVLASNTGIQFVFGANEQPRTDGKRVYLPSLPVTLTVDDLDLIKAFGFHEVGHIQYSDVVFFQAFAAKHGDFARFLLNALDDVYMEYKQTGATREAEIYFRRKARILYERKQFRDGSESVAEAVACYALCYLRIDRWSEYRDPFAVIEANFNKHFGAHADHVRGNLNDILINEFPSVNSTQDAGSLTLRIIAMLKALGDEEEKKDEPKKDDPQGDGQPSSNGDSDSGQGDQGDKPQSGNTDGQKPGEEQGSGAAGNSKPQDGVEPGKDGSQGDSQPQGGGETGDRNCQGEPKSAGSDDAGPGDAPGAQGGAAEGGKEDQTGSSDAANGRSLKEIVDEILNATGLGDKEVFDGGESVGTVSKSVKSGTNPDYKGQSLAPDCVIDGKLDQPPGKEGKGLGGGAGNKEKVDGMTVCPVDVSEAREMEKRMGRKAQVLASKLQGLLMQQEEAESFTTSRGQLGQNHLYRLGLGDVRLFTQSEEIERPTTAVSIVVDLSSSTQDAADKAFAKGEKEQFEAAKAPSTLRSILESVVLLEKVFDQIGCPREVLGFAPKGGELMSMARCFGDNTQTAINRIGGLRKVAGGGHTPIGEAVFHAGRRLLTHEANRKVMFVLTDGAPGNVDKAVEMTRFCESGGVRVVYLVIGKTVKTDWLTEARIPFAVAESSAEVTPALLAEAKRLLM
ncbi:VWA domain-containing protein [Pseudomonas sp. P66]|uniref:VWA domain-containing protein n=1 Tax=Pseudomonas arcuscaelestis TaxID=2710591 RepID=A0ABS2BZA2_9PSED|nr:VWA domain-containing protein [Pseudomonas arcuscaelestis]MBM5458951.1 VWA domain-containing protein [Pseudomonas arcuscaelestis]